MRAIHRALLPAVFSFLFAIASLSSRGQTSTTFIIEDLKRPALLLNLSSYNDILESLIRSDTRQSKKEIADLNIPDPYGIVAKSKLPDSLVNFGYHPFFNGMYQAYADHRPFTLSPDMIWLLISQGFARHVNQHAEELRKQFVSFTGKETLIVRDDRIVLDDPNSPWEEVFPEFTRQIGERTGKDLIQTLGSDFSTTTPVSKVASEITVMEALKSYFDFVVIRIVCGIPEITLQGTPADWEKLRVKAGKLRKYQLDWWIDELDPILDEFIKFSRGKVDIEFWRNMFKYHSDKKYGAPRIIDGWIVKFFPYDKLGKRASLKEISGMDNLPNEIVKVDLQYIELQQSGAVQTPLELWAGFVGLRQDPKNFGLTPQIGWMIRKKDSANLVLKEKLVRDNVSGYGGIQIRVKEVPKEILGLGYIKSLEIYFIDDIVIPDAMQFIKIDDLRLHGRTTDAEIERLKKLFPRTNLIINDNSYPAPRPGQGMIRFPHD